jgi:hypothetical protein
MFKIKPGLKGVKGTEEEYKEAYNPVAAATMKIAASIQGKTVQRKISGFLLDSQIVTTNDKRRAKKAKDAEP